MRNREKRIHDNTAGFSYREQPLEENPAVLFEVHIRKYRESDSHDVYAAFLQTFQYLRL